MHPWSIKKSKNSAPSTGPVKQHRESGSTRSTYSSGHRRSGRKLVFNPCGCFAPRFLLWHCCFAVAAMILGSSMWNLARSSVDIYYFGLTGWCDWYTEVCESGDTAAYGVFSIEQNCEMAEICEGLSITAVMADFTSGLFELGSGVSLVVALQCYNSKMARFSSIFCLVAGILQSLALDFRGIIYGNTKKVIMDFGGSAEFGLITGMVSALVFVTQLYLALCMFFYGKQLEAGEYCHEDDFFEYEVIAPANNSGNNYYSPSHPSGYDASGAPGFYAMQKSPPPVPEYF